MGALKCSENLFADIGAAISFDQPKLSVRRVETGCVVEGAYVLTEDDCSLKSAGAITEFEIKIVIDDGFPVSEPIVYETAGRIPRIVARHINSDSGDCCIGVWEEWLASSKEHTFSAFLNGPVRSFFLSQFLFEKTGNWRFGERSHYDKGLFEAYADVLGITCNEKDVRYYLKLLSQSWPKGHRLCPCGSGKRLRHCHRVELYKLHLRIAPWLAKRMLSRLPQERVG